MEIREALPRFTLPRSQEMKRRPEQGWQVMLYCKAPLQRAAYLLDSFRGEDIFINMTYR
jgi:hypothetical protein